MTSGTRLVGVELFSERAGDSATFYSWLLGPGSGSSVTDWNPVSLLFDHGVCGLRNIGDDGPHPSWVPVISTDDPARTLELSATALILVHNHPSGDPSPSSADVQMTRQINDVARPLGITVHDHIIIGKAGHASMRGLKLI